MTVDCEVLEMKIGEKTSLEFEHSSYLAADDSLTGFPAVSETSSGSVITLGSASIVGTKVVVLVTATGAGKSIVDCSADTTLGSLSIDNQKVFVD